MSAYSLEIEGLVRRKQELEAEADRLREELRQLRITAAYWQRLAEGRDAAR